VHLAEFEVLPWFSADFAAGLRGFDFPHLSTAGPIPRNRLSRDNRSLNAHHYF
jgi:hypothetical protein